jgi:biopolymer transport protein ExbD
MRQVDPKVSYEVPQGTEVQKLGHKSSVVHIYIGKTKSGDFAIQLNNRIATVDEIKTFIESERRMMSTEDQSQLTVSIKADREVPMGIISDVKHALQQSMALRINYAATERK